MHIYVWQSFLSSSWFSLSAFLWQLEEAKMAVVDSNRIGSEATSSMVGLVGSNALKAHSHIHVQCSGKCCWEKNIAFIGAGTSMANMINFTRTISCNYILTVKWFRFSIQSCSKFLFPKSFVGMEGMNGSLQLYTGKCLEKPTIVATLYSEWGLEYKWLFVWLTFCLRVDSMPPHWQCDIVTIFQTYCTGTGTVIIL